MRKTYLATVVNLVIAELEAIQAYQNFLSSPLAILHSFSVVPVLVIPVLLTLRRGNPFGFPFFVVLISLNMGILLAKSEIFYAALDAVHFFGFENLAEYLNTIFSPYAEREIMQSLLVITLLFVVSQLMWVTAEKAEELEKRGLNAGKTLAFQWAYVLAISCFVYTAYPAILVKVDWAMPPLFTGVAGVLAIVIAAYLISRY